MKYKLKNLIFKSGKSQWQICRELNWPEAKLSRFVTGRRALNNLPKNIEPE